MARRLPAAILALLAGCLFFFEYLPPFKRVHLPYDIQGFHYPLAEYAFQALRQGRLPEWDPSMYCGLSFAGNVQAALFYPPNWLLWAANLGADRLFYQSFQLLALAHVWLAFGLCYWWLTGRRLASLPAALGAAVFAYSGYMMSQIQHLGVVAGWAWIPLGLRGIDEAAASGRWRPPAKLVAASALCFLAGYPPAWFVFGTCALVYAAAGSRRWRATAAAALALAASLAVAMVQLLPSLEAAAFSSRDLHYAGIEDARLFLSYLIPNYYDLGLESTGTADPTAQYFYLGAPALFGLAWLAWRRRAPAQGLALAAVCLAAQLDPFGAVSAVVSRWFLLDQVCRAWNFFAGLTLAAALAAATAIDDFLRRPSRDVPRWAAPLVVLLLAGWSLRQLGLWLPGGADFASGWRGVVDPAVMLLLFSLALWLLRAAQGPRRAALAAALLLAVAVDYKVFGTSRRFNAERGDADEFYSGGPFRGMDDAVYWQLLTHPEYRVVIEDGALATTDLRRFALSTPQGSDPLLPVRYKRAIESAARFLSDRELSIDPDQEALLRRLGVRYFLTVRGGPLAQALARDPRYRPLEPSTESYYRVFEYLRADPAFRWDAEEGSATRAAWTPERRSFLVRSARGGRLALIEQAFPGWRASLDGRPLPIELWDQTFQAVRVPPGEHRVEFEFRSRGLRAGAVISAASLLAGCGLWIAGRRRR